MPNKDRHARPPPATDDIAPKTPRLGWLGKFDHGFEIVKGLSVVTVSA